MWRWYHSGWPCVKTNRIVWYQMEQWFKGTVPVLLWDAPLQGVQPVTPNSSAVSPHHLYSRQRLPSKALCLCRYWNSDTNVCSYLSKSVLTCLPYILQLELYWQTKHECSVGKKSAEACKPDLESSILRTHVKGDIETWLQSCLLMPKGHSLLPIIQTVMMVVVVVMITTVTMVL